MRLRQVVLVARDLDRVAGDLCAVLGIEVAFHDPGVKEFGLKNAVMPIGDTFLEVISPIEPSAPAERYLERHGGDGGYMVIVQVDDWDGARERMKQLGIRIVWSMTLPEIRGMHLHPRDVGGAILSLDEATPAASWRWAGPDWEKKIHRETTSTISAVELGSEDPALMAQTWSEVLDRSSRRSEAGSFEIPLGQGTIRFIRLEKGESEGVRGFDVAAVDKRRILAEARARGLETSENQVMAGGARIRLI